MLDPVELARPAVNKTIVPERKGRGRKGYGRLAALRLLVYALLVGIDKDEPLEKYLRKNRGVARAAVSFISSYAHCMGCIMVPCILYFAGLKDSVLAMLRL